MSFTFESYQALLLPVVAVFAYFGWQRGGWGELGYALGMSLVVLATVVFPTQFIGFIERIIITLPRIFSLLFGLDVPAPDAGTLFGAPGTGRFLLTQVVLFALGAFLVYSQNYGWAYEAGKPRKPKTSLGKAMGLLFGALSGFLWFLAINNFLEQLRVLRGGQALPLEGTTIRLPTLNDPNALITFVPTIVVVLIVALVILALLRLPNIWKG